MIHPSIKPVLQMFQSDLDHFRKFKFQSSGELLKFCHVCNGTCIGVSMEEVCDCVSIMRLFATFNITVAGDVSLTYFQYYN